MVKRGAAIISIVFAMGAIWNCPRGHAATPLKTIRVGQSLSFPLFVTHAPGDFERVFIVEQAGRIKIRKNGVILPTAFLNVDPLALGSGERGLLGLAFHPQYAANGFLYVYYINNAGDTVVARYRVSLNPDVVDDTSGSTVLTIAQPRDAQGVLVNHKAGWMGFGPNDGYLYIASGDGGWRSVSNPDPGNRGQIITNNLLGKILRIDVDSDDFPLDDNRNYANPPENPFVGTEGDDEIWAYGLRNPWRCAFDSATGDLFIADVGHSEWEEINFEPADSPGGRNYGWKCMEGNHCSGFGGCTCDDPSLTDPIHEYEHLAAPCYSITGGEVYRGCALDDFDGTYFFGDFCLERLWTLDDPQAAVPTVTDRTSELAPDGAAVDAISSFGLDAAGEIYICDRAGGEVFKIVPDVAISISASDPPMNAIDARRPIDPTTGSPEGWSAVTISFSRPIPCLTELDFFTVQQGGVGPVPEISNVAQSQENEAVVTLERPITPLAWTTVSYETGGVSVRLGMLPADVTGNGVSDTSDMTSLVQQLGGATALGPIWSIDLDRSTAITPADILEAADLLAVYLGETLP
jgi:glucose/arabinose dehydrogenase